MRRINDEILGKISRQFTIILRKVQDGSLDAHKVMLGLQHIIRGDFLHDEPPPVYKVTVDYSISLEDFIDAGAYDWVNSNITETNFPSTEKGVDVIDAHIIHFGKRSYTEAIFQSFDKQGLRAATLKELLAFGAAYPDVQRQFPIVALGSLCQGARDNNCVPELWGADCERVVNLEGCGVWSSRYRFMCLPK